MSKKSGKSLKEKRAAKRGDGTQAPGVETVINKKR